MPEDACVLIVKSNTSHRSQETQMALSPHPRGPLPYWLLTLTEAKVDSLAMHLLDSPHTKLLPSLAAFRGETALLSTPQSFHRPESQDGDTQGNTVQRIILVRHGLLSPRHPCRVDRVEAVLVPVGGRGRGPFYVSKVLLVIPEGKSARQLGDGGKPLMLFLLAR